MPTSLSLARRARNLTPQPGARLYYPRNPEPNIQNPKPETSNLKPETRNPKPESRSPNLEIRSPKPETRNPKLMVSFEPENTVRCLKAPTF